MAKQKLKRELGIFGAVLIGLGSILGTGVFVIVGDCVEMVGPLVLVAILVGGIVASCNGLNSAQLAANFPVSGGTYEYGYRLLSPAYGFIAGWMFLLAKSASAAAAALALGRMCGDGFVPVAAALGIIVVMMLVILGGVRRTHLVNTVIVTITLGALLTYISESVNLETPLVKVPSTGADFFEVCALIFVGFTGYGRIATMGEEISHPRRNIPIAMFITLLVSGLLYAGVAWAELKQTVPPQVWQIGMVTALVGVLLNLIQGLSRILFAMGRRNDMPEVFGRVSAKNQPRWAVVGVSVLVGLLILLGDIKLAWSFSAFTVLIYYAICNMAALQLNAKQAMYSHGLGYVGLASCLFLAFWVDWKAWTAGLLLIGLGLLWHRARHPEGFPEGPEEG